MSESRAPCYRVCLQPHLHARHKFCKGRSKERVGCAGLAVAALLQGRQRHVAAAGGARADAGIPGRGQHALRGAVRLEHLLHARAWLPALQRGHAAVRHLCSGVHRALRGGAPAFRTPRLFTSQFGSHLSGWPWL